MAVRGHCLEHAGGWLLSSRGWTSCQTPCMFWKICQQLSGDGSLWFAIEAQSSVNKASVISLSTVFVFAVRYQRSNSEPSHQFLMFIPRSRSLKAYISTWIKNRSNSTEKNDAALLYTIGNVEFLRRLSILEMLNFSKGSPWEYLSCHVIMKQLDECGEL